MESTAAEFRYALFPVAVDPSSSRSLAARFLVFLLWAVKMSDLECDGRGRPDDVREILLLLPSLESNDES